MFLLIVLVVAAIVVGLSHRDWYDAERQDLRGARLSAVLVRAVLIAVPLGLVLTVLKDSIVIIPAGYRGVVFDKVKGVRPTALNEGVNFVVPVIQDVTTYDIRVQKVEFEATAASKDLQSVRTKVALNVRPDANAVADLHRNFGPLYAEKVIHPAVQEAVKSTTARYTAEELITKREDVKKNIQDMLRAQAAPANLSVTETYITDFDFSREFASAVEAKQIAEQQAFKAKRDLDRVKIEADQKIAQARAEAESLRMQREAITPNLIELRRIEAQKLAIEKWDGRLPQTIMGGATPFIDVSRFTANTRNAN